MHPSFRRGRAGPGTDGSFASVAMRPPGWPWFRRAGESALHERDHRGGDHPIPFRTRPLSPPSPKVLQRQAAGGQGVALMQGASAFQWGLRALFLFGAASPFFRFGPKSERAFGPTNARTVFSRTAPLASSPLSQPVKCSQRLTGSREGGREPGGMGSREGTEAHARCDLSSATSI